MKKVTLVTCCYDLVKRGSGEHRSIDWMLTHGGYVLGLDQELMIFADPELAADLIKVRGGRPTKIVTIGFEDLLGDIRVAAVHRGSLQQNARKTKVTATYVQLMWSKYAMLEKALELTDASHVGWIDFSIAHVAKLPPEGVDVFADPPDAPRVHVLRCFNKRTVDHPDYWRYVHGHLAGGLVVGGRDGIAQLVHDFWGAVDHATAIGLSPLDEGVLSYIVAQRPSDFSYSYGDYEDILQNHDAPRGGEAHRRWIVEDARSQGLPDVMGGDLPARRPRYVCDPERGSSQVTGFPTVVLDYAAEGSSHIVPGRYERDLVDWARQLAPSGTQFVDCGAHMGSWSIVMARYFREVHAFEPQRLIFQQLCANAALNGLTNVFARNVGLDERPGQLTLHRPGIDRGSSSVRLDVVQRFEAAQIATSPETIEVVTLDSCGSALTNVGLVKIDVEGLELRVLKGAVETLRRNALPKLLVECWSDEWYRQDKEALLAFLDQIGYRTVAINGYPDMLLAESASKEKVSR